MHEAVERPSVKVPIGASILQSHFYPKSHVFLTKQKNCEASKHALMLIIERIDCAQML